ncbi:MAG TPA: ABC transporter permease [Actinomycetota bacterium]
MRLRRVLLSVLAPVSALIAALAISSVALLLIHKNPFTAFKSMFSYGIQTSQMISIVNVAVPLYLSALAVAIGFKMNLFNIGVNGQYLLAALIAAWAGQLVNLPAPLEILYILLVAMAVGSFWAGIAGVLKVTRGVHEVIGTIMLNTIATGVSSYLLFHFLRQKSTAANLTTQTPFLPKSANFPNLAHGAPENLTGFAVVALIVGALYYVVVWRTRFGYNLRASGLNPEAARVSGVDPRGMILKTMLLSGAIAGLVGMTSLLTFNHAYTLDFPADLGFTGIAVALVGRNHPVGIGVAALLFGFLQISAQILDFNDIPKEIFLIMEGVIILTVVVAYELVRRAVERQEVKAAAEGSRRLAEARAEHAEGVTV